MSGGAPKVTAPVVLTMALEDIRTDGGTQARLRLDPETCNKYMDVRIEGKSFKDPAVVFSDGEDSWLADGFHRHEGTRKAVLATNGRVPATLEVEVRQGTRRDAILFACSANVRHGLRPSREDKRHAVRMLLADREWSQFSNRTIAELCDVHHDTVGVYRREFEAEEHARRSQLELPATGGSASSSNAEPATHPGTTRIGKDGKTRDTTGISQSNRRRDADTTLRRFREAAELIVEAHELGAPPDRAGTKFLGMVGETGDALELSVPMCGKCRARLVDSDLEELAELVDEWDAEPGKGATPRNRNCLGCGGATTLRYPIAALWPPGSAIAQRIVSAVPEPAPEGGLIGKLQSVLEERRKAREQEEDVDGDELTDPDDASAGEDRDVPGELLELARGGVADAADRADGPDGWFPLERADRPPAEPLDPAVARAAALERVRAELARLQPTRDELPAVLGDLEVKDVRAAVRTQRRTNDAYYTPEGAAYAIVRHLVETKRLPRKATTTLLEPHVGGGAWVSALKRARVPGLIHASDVDPNAAGLVHPDGDVAGEVADFLVHVYGMLFDVILGNPPFGNAEEHVRRALELLRPGGLLIFLLRRNWLGAARFDFIAEGRAPVDEIVLAPRLSFTDGGTDEQEYSVFIWRGGEKRHSWRTSMLDVGRGGRRALTDSAGGTP